MSEFALSYESCIEAARLASSRGDRLGAEQALIAAIGAAGSDGAEAQQVAALVKLGELKRDEGSLAEAEEMFARALEISEIVRDDDSGLVAALTSLAGIRSARGASESAEQLLTRALTLTEKRLGREHPHLVVLLNDLSRLYLKRSAYGLAEPLLHRLHAIKRLKGEDHAEVATVLASLATVRQALGDHDAAEQLWRRVLAIRERTLAPNHFAIATAIEHLADTCSARGKVAEALGLFRRALAMREMTLGLAHPSLRTVRERIADLQLQGADEFAGEDAAELHSPPAAVRVPPAASYPAVELPPRMPVARPAIVERPLTPGMDVGHPSPRPASPSRSPELAPERAAASTEQDARMVALRELAALSVQATAPVREPVTPAPTPYNQPSAPELEVPVWQHGTQAVVPVAAARAPHVLSIVLPTPADGDADDDEQADSDYQYALAQTRMQRVAGSLAAIFRERQAQLAAAGALAVVLVVVAAASASQARGGATASPLGAGVPAQQYVAGGAAVLGDSGRSSVLDTDRATADATADARQQPAPVAAADRARPEASTPERPTAKTVTAPKAEASTAARPPEMPAALSGISTASLDSAMRAAAPGRVAIAPAVEKPAFESGIGAVDYTNRGTQPPLLIGDFPRIPYPQNLRIPGRERGGQVTVEFLVDTLGRADMATIRVIRSDHEQLTSAVYKAIPDLRFVPGTTGGRKAARKIQMPFDFTAGRE